LIELLKAGTLFDFLESELGGEKLIDKLGGWLKKALPLRGRKVIAYHKNWAYFVKDFGIEVVGYVERIPGIPPTPKHVEQCIRQIQDMDVDVMIVASYFEKRKPMTIAQKTGIKPVFLPLSVAGVEEASDNFKLIDYWIETLLNTLE
jgi:ABC-type Zn uptake system ZnuABC Zn-binding protein ZnuA